MRLNRRRLLLGTAAIAGMAECHALSATVVPALKDRFAAHFKIGMAVDTRLLSAQITSTILRKHVNSLTPENVMKADLLGPREGIYNFKQADALVAFAQANHMVVQGTTLLWHRSTPDWFFAGDQSDMTAYRAQVRARLERYITDVVTHFRGKVSTWIVVNEPTSDDGSNIWRQTRWYQVLGPDYIDYAFRAARAADPNVKLVINEYLTEDAGKRARFLTIVDEMLAREIPLDGIGHQMHIGLLPRAWKAANAFTAADVGAALQAVESRGLDNHITELDVTLYDDPVRCYATSTDCLPAATGAGLTAALQAQADKYRQLFAVFTAYGSVKSVTLWGVADNHTWLDTYPVARANKPLLFDANGAPKPAFWAIVDSI